MIDKAEYLAFWGYIEGTPEAEEAWLAKVALMEGRHARSAPMVFVQQDIHYQSPVSGRVIRTKHEREYDLRSSGCVEYEPGMKQDAARRQKDMDANLDSSIERHVEASIEKMPSAKRERLANELSAGVTAEPVRLSSGG